MKFLLAVALFGAFACTSAFADEMFDDAGLVDDSEARFLYFNTSSTATSLTLLGALILLGVIAYLIYAGGLLGSSTGYNRNDYANQGQYYDESQYAQYRSSKDESKFDVMKVLEWMSIAREMYDNFDYNDLECQKRLICEIVQNEPIFGTGAITIKQATRAARYLEMFTLPDEIREVVDEMMDAAARGEQNVSCGDYFRCPFSIKETTSNMLN